MKKALILIMVLIMVLGFVGCSSAPATAEEVTPEPTKTTSESLLAEKVSASFSEAFGSNITKYEYDDNSNLILSTSENFNGLTTTVYEYSDDNILIRSTTTYKKHDGFSSTTVEEYNEFGDVIKNSFTNSNGIDSTATYEYTYNEDKKPATFKEVVFVDGEEIRSYTISYSYSENQTTQEIIVGNEITTKIIEFDSNGNEILCTKRTKNKKTQTQIGDTNIEYQYSNTYDEKGNLIKREDTRKITDGSYLDYEWEYNENNLVIAEKVYLGEKLMCYTRYIYS